MTALVSVIIPSYNHARFLVERIESIIGQTYSAIEIILLDDCSTDESREILERYEENSRVSVLQCSVENSGSPFNQWFKGVDMAQGEYIYIAESDDLAEHNFLEEMVPVLVAESTRSLVFCESLEIDQDGVVIGSSKDLLVDYKPGFDGCFSMSGSEFCRRYMLSFNVISNVSSVVFRKSMIDQMNASVVDVMANMRYVGDWLFYLSLLSSGEIAYLEKPLNKFRQHQNTTRVSGSIDDFSDLKKELSIVYTKLKELFPSMKDRCDAYYEGKVSLYDLMAASGDVGRIKEACDVGDIYIYGAGALGRKMYIYISSLLNDFGEHIKAFVDRRAMDNVFCIDGLPVISPDEFYSCDEVGGVIVASVAFYDDISEQLVERGLESRIINVGAR